MMEESREGAPTAPPTTNSNTLHGQDQSTDHLPVVCAVKISHKRLKFRCDYCRAWHVHGKGEGHRVAHCTDRTSPYMATGYVLRVEGGDDR